MVNGGEDDGGEEYPDEGWVLRAAGLITLWLFAVAAIVAIWGFAIERNRCRAGARHAPSKFDGLNVAAGCVGALDVPSTLISMGIVLAIVGGLAIALACRAADRRAVSSPDGRVRGRSARLREGW